MTIRVRDITGKEAETLDHWQRCDDVVGYRRARMLRLSEHEWQCADIADVLGVHVETVRELIKSFNKGGIDAIAPRPRSGGR
jgi:transposase